MSIDVAATFDGRAMLRKSRVWRKTLIEAMHDVTLDAEKQLRTDYLRRGGSFRRTKANHWRWVKNPGKSLRVGNATLLRSWRARRPDVRGTKIVGRISSTEKYARVHEEGGMVGPSKSRYQEPRPYITPMVQDNKERWLTMFGHSVHVSMGE